MKIEYFYIKGFRRIIELKLQCGEATFLIGENNVGKSSILRAMEIFFSGETKLNDEDFFKIDEPKYQVEEIVLEAKLTDLPDESHTWRGFKGRIFKEEINGQVSNCIYYRKVFKKGATNVIREMMSCRKSLKEEFSECKTLENFIQTGLSEEIVNECFDPKLDRQKKLSPKERENLELISELWNIGDDDPIWENNPGGIDGNITIRLPKFLLIPAESKKEEIDGSSGTLQKTMRELFEDVRDLSENFRQAQHYLNLLADELDPEDNNKEFGLMLSDVNKIIGDIFSKTKVHITTTLSDANSSIKPSFDIEMSSNVRTKPDKQGMGTLRSTVFALLRYREQFLEKKKAKGEIIRTLIIGFEEPEMYLHPNAASMMREKIYELATSSNSKIICTTHSPYMIDLSRKIDEENYPKQVLNSLRLEFDVQLNIEVTKVNPFNTTEAYKRLHENDKTYVKFLLKIDDNIAKVFFSKRVIIVEGDTEDLLIKETVDRLPQNKKNEFLCHYQIVKARGKAVIISLVKYLEILGIKPFVIHDHDTEPGAIKFNDPILKSLGNGEDRRLLIMNTIEDVLGYEEPTNEKPYKAYEHISQKWGSDWYGIQDNWREIFEKNISPELFR